MSIWSDFSKLVGVSPRHAEDALYSERAARATLSRRGMLGASAALAAGVAFGFPTPPKGQVFRLVYADTDGNYLWVPFHGDWDAAPRNLIIAQYEPLEVYRAT